MKVNFEELTTITTQIEACLNSRLPTSLPENTSEIEALALGHFKISRPFRNRSSIRVTFRSEFITPTDAYVDTLAPLPNARRTFLAMVVLVIIGPASKIL